MIVGERVRVKGNLVAGKHYSGQSFEEEMIQYEGEEAVIMSIEQEEGCSIAYLLDIDGQFWSWGEDMLEAIAVIDPTTTRTKLNVLFRYDEEMEHMVIYNNDGTTVDDRAEGFPKLSAIDVLKNLSENGIINLTIEKIE